MKKPSEIIRHDIAERIERLYQNIDEIRRDYSAVTLEQRIKMTLDKVARLIEAETEEQNVGED